MKKITDLKFREVIHCETKEEATAICILMDRAGLRWKSKEKYTSNNQWKFYKEDTCYHPKGNSYSDVEFYKEEGYKIYPASDFLGLVKQ